MTKMVSLKSDKKICSKRLEQVALYKNFCDFDIKFILLLARERVQKVSDVPATKS